MTKRTHIQKIATSPAAAEAAHLTLGDRVYLRFGWPMVKSLHVTATVLAFGLVLFLDYLLVLFTAVNVLPNIAALIQQGTGVTVEMRIDAVIAGWLIPVLFIVAAVLVGEIFLMRRMWRFAAGRLKALAGWLFRLEDQKRSGRQLALLPNRARSSRAPKIAALT